MFFIFVESIYIYMTMEGYSAKGNTRGGGRTRGGAGRAVRQDERWDRTSGGQDERMVRTVDGTCVCGCVCVCARAQLSAAFGLLT